MLSSYTTENDGTGAGGHLSNCQNNVCPETTTPATATTTSTVISTSTSHTPVNFMMDAEAAAESATSNANSARIAKEIARQAASAAKSALARVLALYTEAKSNPLLRSTHLRGEADVVVSYADIAEAQTVEVRDAAARATAAAETAASIALRAPAAESYSTTAAAASAEAASYVNAVNSGNYAVHSKANATEANRLHHILHSAEMAAAHADSAANLNLEAQAKALTAAQIAEGLTYPSSSAIADAAALTVQPEIFAVNATYLAIIEEERAADEIADRMEVESPGSFAESARSSASAAAQSSTSALGAKKAAHRSEDEIVQKRAIIAAAEINAPELALAAANSSALASAHAAASIQAASYAETLLSIVVNLLNRSKSDSTIRASDLESAASLVEDSGEIALNEALDAANNLQNALDHAADALDAAAVANVAKPYADNAVLSSKAAEASIADISVGGVYGDVVALAAAFGMSARAIANNVEHAENASSIALAKCVAATLEASSAARNASIASTAATTLLPVSQWTKAEHIDLNAVGSYRDDALSAHAEAIRQQAVAIAASNVVANAAIDGGGSAFLNELALQAETSAQTSTDYVNAALTSRNVAISAFDLLERRHEVLTALEATSTISSTVSTSVTTTTPYLCHEQCDYGFGFCRGSIGPSTVCTKMVNFSCSAPYVSCVMLSTTVTSTVSTTTLTTSITTQTKDIQEITTTNATECSGECSFQTTGACRGVLGETVLCFDYNSSTCAANGLTMCSITTTEPPPITEFHITVYFDGDLSQYTSAEQNELKFKATQMVVLRSGRTTLDLSSVLSSTISQGSIKVMVTFVSSARLLDVATTAMLLLQDINNGLDIFVTVGSKGARLISMATNVYVTGLTPEPESSSTTTTSTKAPVVPGLTCGAAPLGVSQIEISSNAVCSEQAGVLNAIVGECPGQSLVGAFSCSQGSLFVPSAVLCGPAIDALARTAIKVAAAIGSSSPPSATCMFGQYIGISSSECTAAVTSLNGLISAYNLKKIANCDVVTTTTTTTSTTTTTETTTSTSLTTTTLTTTTTATSSATTTITATSTTETTSITTSQTTTTATTTPCVPTIANPAGTVTLIFDTNPRIIVGTSYLRQQFEVTLREYIITTFGLTGPGKVIPPITFVTTGDTSGANKVFVSITSTIDLSATIAVLGENCGFCPSFSVGISTTLCARRECSARCDSSTTSTTALNESFSKESSSIGLSSDMIILVSCVGALLVAVAVAAIYGFLRKPIVTNWNVESVNPAFDSSDSIVIGDSFHAESDFLLGHKPTHFRPEDVAFGATEPYVRQSPVREVSNYVDYSAGAESLKTRNDTMPQTLAGLRNIVKLTIDELQQCASAMQGDKDGLITQDEFNEIWEHLHVSTQGGSTQFASQVFNVFDANGDGTIQTKEFVVFLAIASNSDIKTQLSAVFKVFDIDNSGSLDQEEMVNMLETIHGLDKRGNDDIDIDELADMIMIDIDEDGNGTISCDEWVTVGSADNMGLLAGIFEAPFLDPDSEEEAVPTLKSLKDVIKLTADELQRCAIALESDADGKITMNEFVQIWEGLNIKDNQMTDTRDFCRTIFMIFDNNGDGFINPKEFLVFVALASNQTKIAQLNAVFKVFDIDNSGTIDLSEMVAIIKTISTLNKNAGDDSMSPEMLANMIFMELDVNQDGTISHSEWVGLGNPDASGILNAIIDAPFSEPIQTEDVEEDDDKLTGFASSGFPGFDESDHTVNESDFLSTEQLKSKFQRDKNVLKGQRKEEHPNASSASDERKSKKAEKAAARRVKSEEKRRKAELKKQDMAAAKIQAGFRGKKGRDKVKAMRAAKGFPGFVTDDQGCSDGFSEISKISGGKQEDDFGTHICVESYIANKVGHLSLSPGMPVRVDAEGGGGLLFGEIEDGSDGQFPASCVMEKVSTVKAPGVTSEVNSIFGGGKGKWKKATKTVAMSLTVQQGASAMLESRLGIKVPSIPGVTDNIDRDEKLPNQQNAGLFKKDKAKKIEKKRSKIHEALNPKPIAARTAAEVAESTPVIISDPSIPIAAADLTDDQIPKSATLDEEVDHFDPADLPDARGLGLTVKRAEREAAAAQKAQEIAKKYKQATFKEKSRIIMEQARIKKMMDEKMSMANVVLAKMIQVSKERTEREMTQDIFGSFGFSASKAASNDGAAALAALNTSSYGINAEAIASQALADKVKDLFTIADKQDGMKTFDTACADSSLGRSELNFRLNKKQLLALLEKSGEASRFDSNGDGNLSVDEIYAAADKNDDGEVSLEELLAACVPKLYKVLYPIYLL